NYWAPMQSRLDDNLTEYIRHFLMRDGKIVRQSDVYFTLKEGIDCSSPDDIVAYLQEVALFSTYYARLLDPSTNENRPQIAEPIKRLNRYDATTVYPFLLNIYHQVEQNRISVADFATILGMVESFLVRRFICGVATSGLTKIFPAL